MEGDEDEEGSCCFGEEEEEGKRNILPGSYEEGRREARVLT